MAKATTTKGDPFMKRFGNLWSDIISFQNLLYSSRKAQKGKRYRDNVLSFNYNLENEILTLQSELKNHTYQPGDYRIFHIFEPKPRLISAAPYRDRVVHHALCNVIAPILERTLIYDTYANRTGFGSHRALRRFTKFARNSKYVLQCDIQKYFPSIDHEILKEQFRCKIKCKETLWLIDTIIDASNPQEIAVDYFIGDELFSPLDRRKGLPIGNLTSQFFANFYLSGFDHFVKETLKTEKYLRYVDDFALFSEDRVYLQEARTAIETHLASLRLKIHPIKSQLSETSIGVCFVGFRVLPDRIRVRSNSLKRSRCRLLNYKKAYAKHQITAEHLIQSILSWIAHLKHGNTWRLRQKIFADLAFTRPKVKEIGRPSRAIENPD
jgi:retron-type reverse transcriptase